jgi:hypothetical protein
MMKSSRKIKIKLKKIDIPNMLDPNIKKLAEKINEIVFVINELNISIYEDDDAAKIKWKDFIK